MEAYPPVYIQKGHGRIYEVYITSYQESVSINAFHNHWLSTAHKLFNSTGNRKGLGYEAYQHIYKVYSRREFNLHNAISIRSCRPERVKVVSNICPSLLEFYKQINYNHRTKKINGKTVYRYIIDEVKSQ